MARLGFLGRTRRSVIGLDVGSSAVRAAQVSLGGPRPVVEKLGQVALPPGTMADGQTYDPPALTAAVLELRTALGLPKGSVVLGCEQLRGTNRFVELPWVPRELRQRALPLLAADVLPSASGEEPQSVVVDFVENGRSTSDDGSPLMFGMVVVAYDEPLLTLIGAVEAAGLQVSRVDLSAFGLVRSMAADLDGQRPEAIIDIGTRTGIVVIHTGGQPQVVRMFPVPAESHVGRLVEEVNKTLRLLPDGQSGDLSRIAVSGGAATREAVESLASDLSASADFAVPVEVESAFRNVVLGDLRLGAQQLQIMSATAGVCIGLALGEAA